jgi:hypothetical protein
VIDQLSDEAARQGTPLSDVERAVLVFHESPHMPREMRDVMETFEREYDEQEYERRIVALLRDAYKRTRSSEKKRWAAALRELRDSDVYLGVMVDVAALRPPGDLWRLFGLGCLLMVLGVGAAFLADPLDSVVERHVTREHLALYVWLFLLASAGLFTVARWIFGASAVDDQLDRAIDFVSFRRGRSRADDRD